jgi:hypothetical protein
MTQLPLSVQEWAMLADARAFAHYLRDLPSYLREQLTREQCQSMIDRALARRSESFLEILERAVFANANSPYRRLCERAGVELADAVALVNEHGLEGALAALYESGIYVRLEEAKGYEPIRRPGLELAVSPRDFDSPLSSEHFDIRSGGSRSAGTRVSVDLDLLAHEGAQLSSFMSAFGVHDRPIGLWYPVPPGVAGIKLVLELAKVGVHVERWFSQTEPGLLRSSLRHALLIRSTVGVSRLLREPIPAPEHTPSLAAERVAIWLAEKRARGTPAFFLCTPSSGVRVCLAAEERGADISGTFFRFGGEPYTPAKASVVSAAGCRAACNYYLTEVGGRVGIACAAPEAVDEVHLMSDALAMIQRPREVAGGKSVDALLYTTLLPASPKIMINLESDDYATISRRSCGCPFDAAFPTHLHTIRSHEKLTSEGMSFLGSELHTLVEEILPARFGGSLLDYQLVETEESGLTRVEVVVSPRVGEVDAGAVLESVLSFLRSRGRAQEMMAEVWAASGTVRVTRREPQATPGTKVLPLHISRDGPGNAAVSSQPPR